MLMSILSSTSRWGMSLSERLYGSWDRPMATISSFRPEEAAPCAISCVCVCVCVCVHVWLSVRYSTYLIAYTKHTRLSQKIICTLHSKHSSDIIPAHWETDRYIGQWLYPAFPAMMQCVNMLSHGRQILESLNTSNYTSIRSGQSVCFYNRGQDLWISCVEIED